LRRDVSDLPVRHHDPRHSREEEAAHEPDHPANFLCTTPEALFAFTLDAHGALTLPLPTPPTLADTFYYQWLVIDAPVDPPGVVTSEGANVTF
jgi:hypothetical protein